MNKFLNMVGMGLIFFGIFMVLFIITMAYEHEVVFMSLLGGGSLVLGMVLAGLGNCRKQ